MADPIKAEIAQLEQQIAQLQSRQQGGGMGLLGGNATFSRSSLPKEQIQQVYGLLASGADNPAQVGNQYVQAMQNQAQLTGAYGSSPSNIREWEYYNALSPEDQRRYLEMKRGIQLETLGGAKVDPGATPGSNVVYSSLQEELNARRAEAAAGTSGTNAAQRYDTLSSSRQQRIENYNQAQRMRALVAQNDLPTGKYRGLLYNVLPTPEQEALDALAEFVARERLKASGEVRPTDADVQGMKRALFGSNRTEEFTVEQLDRLMRELEQQEQEYHQLGQFTGAPGYAPPQTYSPNSPIMPTPNRTPGLLGGDEQQGGARDYLNMSLDELIKEAGP